MKIKTEKVFAINQIDIEPKALENDSLQEAVYVLPTRNFVMFPGVTFSISLGRKSSIEAVERAAAAKQPIVVACQQHADDDTPDIPSDLYRYGVASAVLKVLDIPGGNKTAIVLGLNRVEILGPGTRPYSVDIRVADEDISASDDSEYIRLAKAVKQATLDLLRKTDEAETELGLNLNVMDDADMQINVVATHAPLDSTYKQKQLLEAPNMKIRAARLLDALSEKAQIFSILEKVNERAKANMAESQRISVLQQQMEALRQEIYGEETDDVTTLRRRAAEANLPAYVESAFRREVDKLSRLNPQSPDYAVQYGYLDVLLELPWSKTDVLNDNLRLAEKTLDADHFGLEKVKERIVEQLALMMHSSNNKSPLICLVGPPGVGKTSVGQSIARAMGRKYQRVSLGGLHDEAELRGHRRTYIGAMPGRIIEAVRKAGTSNPMILLDEIDKIGADHKSDPSAALLEILDPEQNCHFHDNYVDIDFDLSNVMFIATANTLNNLSRPLLDRMEVIELSGYVLQEKIEIATRYLIPKQLKLAGFKPAEITFSHDTLEAIVTHYTAESGVRGLEKQIAAIIRKLVVRKLKGERMIRTLKPTHLTTLLGKPTRPDDDTEHITTAGVATGLAWTAAGGETLYIESSFSSAKTPALTLTGQLGDVMKESATIALQYVKAHAGELGIDPGVFDSHSLHIHVPEGAIPKDGPSAGITMCTSIVSAITDRAVNPSVAMTGELTLRGRVLAIGGVKEKILAAKRKGITQIILPKANERDVEEISAAYVEGLTFHYVDTVDKVLRLALMQK